MSVATVLEPILRSDPVGWAGLPPVALPEVDDAFGPPSNREESTLGYYPAVRSTYPLDDGEELVVWSREGAVVMVESPRAPPASVLAALPEPSAILPQEMDVEGGYAHEYLYDGIGLVLTVCEPFDGGERTVIRCRGIAALEGPDEYDTRYHLAIDDQISFGGA